MIKDYRAVQKVASMIADAAETAISAYREQRITDEPHITDRLMGAIEDRVNRYPWVPPDAPAADPPPTLPMRSEDGAPLGHPDRNPVVWKVVTLRAGPKSAPQEKRFGADILGVLEIHTSEYQVSKGFLAQAKRAEPSIPFVTAEWDRMMAQCDAMLGLSPDSFIVAYSKAKGVRFFSAQAARSFKGRDLFELYDMSVKVFFERHIESFIGDLRLNRPHIDVLERLHRDEEARPSAHVLHLKASEAE